MGARLTGTLVVVTALLAMLGLALWDRARLQDKVSEQDTVIVTLRGAVEAQNAAIQEWKTKAEAFEAQAAIRARAALQRRPPLPTGHGPDIMNAWLRVTFTEISPSPSPSPARGEGIISEGRDGP